MPLCFSVGVYGELPGPHVFHGVELDLLEAHNLAVDAHVAVQPPGARERFAFEFLQHLHLGVIDSVGVVIAIDALHIGLALVVSEALHVILARFVQIDGLFVERSQGAGKVHFADYFGFAGGVHDNEVVRRD